MRKSTPLHQLRAHLTEAIRVINSEGDSAILVPLPLPVRKHMNESSHNIARFIQQAARQAGRDAGVTVYRTNLDPSKTELTVAWDR